MATAIGQAVKMLAVFGDGAKLRPLRFMWGPRVYKIREVTYAWDTFEGRELIHHYVVSDGGTLFELSFRTGKLEWTLDTVEEAG